MAELETIQSKTSQLVAEIQPGSHGDFRGTSVTKNLGWLNGIFDEEKHNGDFSWGFEAQNIGVVDGL